MSFNKLDQILDISESKIAVVSKDGRILFSNRPLKKMISLLVNDNDTDELDKIKQT